MTLPFLPAHHHQKSPSLYLWIWTPWCQAFSLLFLGLGFFGICLFRFCFWFRIFGFGFFFRLRLLFFFYLGLRFFGICLFRFCFWFRIFGFGFFFRLRLVVLLLPRTRILWHLLLPILLLVQNLRFWRPPDRPLKLLKQVSYYFSYLL